MYKYCFSLLIFSFISFSIYAQRELELVNSKKIDANRYAGIDDSPYLFKNWLIGNVTTNDGVIVPEVFINYNGYTGDFEIKNGDNFIELENKLYLQIEITRVKNGDKYPAHAGDKMIFQRKLHQRFKENLMRLIYKGKTVSIIEGFRVTVSETTTQDVGKTIVKKRFFGLRSQYALIDGELKPFNLKKSSIIKTFGYRKQMDTFMRKEKINFKDDADLSKLFAYYEGLLDAE